VSFIAELRRRNVIRMAGLYLVGAWLVTQVAGTILPMFGAPDWAARSVVILLAIGFVPALVFSWLFELTPEGLKRDSEVPAGGSIALHTARRMDRMIIVVLLLALSYLAVDKFVLAPARVDIARESSPSTSVGPKSIAVLPFADLSPTGDQEYFSDGIAEEILNALTRVEGLDVASRTSAFQFKGREIGIPEIASTLGVRHVLEGSVRRSGDSLRITAQLIDASNDRHLWSQTFDRALTAENVFQIQDEIAAAITRALGIAMKLGGEQLVSAAGATADIDAYALYLEARTLYHERRGLDRADQLLARALEQDPSFARAWELRAPIPTLAIGYGESSESQEAAEARTHEYAKRALALNPDSSLALATLGKLLEEEGEFLRGFADWAKALDYLERAIKADPNNASAYLWRGNALDSLGFVEEALAAYEQCVALEPLYLPCVNNRPFNMVALGRFDEALARYRQDLGAGLSRFNFGLIPLWVHIDSDLLFMAAANLPDVLQGFPRLAELYTAHRSPGGDHSALLTDALRYLPATITDGGGTIIDMLLVPLGREETYRLHAQVWGPSFRRFRQTEAFKRIVREAGVLAYWREHRFPPICRPVGADDFACD
jgi:TolB-like protein/Tfp pilus assembly protein PilF